MCKSTIILAILTVMARKLSFGQKDAFEARMDKTDKRSNRIQVAQMRFFIENDKI